MSSPLRMLSHYQLDSSRIYLASSFCRWYYGSYTSQSQLAVACSTTRSSSRRTFSNLGTNFKSLPLSLSLGVALTSSYPPKKRRSGTGLLALGLSPLARRYTATDMPALLPLLRRNLLSVPPTTADAITVAALDWTLPTLRQVDVSMDPPDVLLIVDCIYHPTLVRPLLSTMTAIAAPRHTVAVVVAELRAEDVLREFLEGWIELGWRVWSVGEGLLGARWGMWVAWREN
jgi:hypothetical protein